MACNIVTSSHKVGIYGMRSLKRLKHGHSCHDCEADEDTGMHMTKIASQQNSIDVLGVLVGVLDIFGIGMVMRMRKEVISI